VNAPEGISASSLRSRRFVCTTLLVQSITSVILDVAPGVSGRALEAQQHNTNETWTATKQTSPDNTNPSRTTESQAKSGNRSVDIIVGRSFCGGQRKDAQVHRHLFRF